eukprot:TRINITY_DN10854_c0_g1_i1.p1 TRINITY_DN10854_c0_g1~~TRINITY_DN10854_c0_g1_i1.p1  ORF type:complete len:436 (-),score=59.51 TRINITY_DN10854_c0_g1_i1:1138-2445(-)
MKPSHRSLRALLALSFLACLAVFGAAIPVVASSIQPDVNGTPDVPATATAAHSSDNPFHGSELTRVQTFQLHSIAAQAAYLQTLVDTNAVKGKKEFARLSTALVKQAREVYPSADSWTRLLTLHAQAREAAESSTWRDKVAGIFTFVNIVWVVAIIVVVVSISALFGHYFIALLVAIPGVVYEMAAYGTSLAFMVLGYTNYPPHIGQFLALTGALGYGASQCLTKALHFPRQKPNNFAFSVHMAVVFAALALAFDSPVLGFVCIMCVESALGFSVVVAPLCVMLGFPSRDVIPRAVSASFVILAPFVAYRIVGSPVPHLAVFESGALFMGTFVYFIGLLILSSSVWRSVAWQIHLIKIISGIAALYLGSVYGIAQLSGIGGTFFALYGAERFTYLLAKARVHFAWITLGLGLMMYGLSFIVHVYPQYFRLIPLYA